MKTRSWRKWHILSIQPILFLYFISFYFIFLFYLLSFSLLEAIFVAPALFASAFQILSSFEGFSYHINICIRFYYILTLPIVNFKYFSAKGFTTAVSIPNGTVDERSKIFPPMFVKDKIVSTSKLFTVHFCFYLYLLIRLSVDLCVGSLLTLLIVSYICLYICSFIFSFIFSFGRSFFTL